MEKAKSVLFLSVAILLTGCHMGNSVPGAAPVPSLSQSPTQQAISGSVFSNLVTEFRVNVFYEGAAAPYADRIGASNNQSWDITKASFDALFQNHPGRTDTVPVGIQQMTQIFDQNKDSWNLAELTQLANEFAPPLTEGGRVNVSVFFVKGTFRGDANVTGIFIPEQPYAIVFKDVVVSLAGSGSSQRYIEQAVVVHGLGQAIGLVNNGLPMVSNHEDPAHPRHSNDPSCVMYWMIESKNDILTTVAGMISGGKLNLFGAGSVEDGMSYHP